VQHTNFKISSMKRKTLGLTAILLIFVGMNSLKAQDTINVVTTAVPFLRISPDARAGGMGDLGVATSPDANSGMYNLAKTPFATKNASFGLTYTPWLKDLGLNDVYLLSFGASRRLFQRVSVISVWVISNSLILVALTSEKDVPVNSVSILDIPES
jgi:hypothetical protein